METNILSTEAALSVTKHDFTSFLEWLGRVLLLQSFLYNISVLFVSVAYIALASFSNFIATPPQKWLFIVTTFRF